MQEDDRKKHIENINTATRLLGLTGFPVRAVEELETPGRCYRYRIHAIMDNPAPGRRLQNMLNALITYADTRETVDKNKFELSLASPIEQDNDGHYCQDVDITFYVSDRYEMNDTVSKLVLAAKAMTKGFVGECSVRELRRRTLGDDANPARYRN